MTPGWEILLYTKISEFERGGGRGGGWHVRGLAASAGACDEPNGIETVAAETRAGITDYVSRGDAVDKYRFSGSIT